MNNPAIDPSQLTEEQREIIRAEYDHNAMTAGLFAKEQANCRCIAVREWHQGKCDELISIFGKDFFRKEYEK